MIPPAIRRPAALAALMLLQAPAAFAQSGLGAGGGGAWGANPRDLLNRAGNAIVSDLGTGICALALVLAILVALMSSIGERGGGGGVLRTCGWIMAFWCGGWILATITGGANVLGGFGSVI